MATGTRRSRKIFSKDIPDSRLIIYKKSWSWGPSIVVVSYIIILYSQLYTLTPMPPFIQPARSSPSKGMFMLTATLMFMFNVLLDSPVSRMAIMGDDGAGAVALTVPMIHKELRRRRKKTKDDDGASSALLRPVDIKLMMVTFITRMLL